MFLLNNKTAIVTGGADGIGKAISETLAKKGALVYILDVNEETGNKTVENIVKKGFKARFVKADVSNQKQIITIANDIYKKEESIDILVNNAGIAHVGTAENTTENDFDKILSVNIKGVYNCIYSCIPFMKKSGGGVIINMASAASVIGLPDRFAYSASKGAVTTMTYSVARDFVNDKIRCNCIAPGRVHTPFVDGYLKKIIREKKIKCSKNYQKPNLSGVWGILLNCHLGTLPLQR